MSTSTFVPICGGTVVPVTDLKNDVYYTVYALRYDAMEERYIWKIAAEGKFAGDINNQYKFYTEKRDCTGYIYDYAIDVISKYSGIDNKYKFVTHTC